MTAGRGAWVTTGGTIQGCYQLSVAPGLQVGSEAVQDPTLDLLSYDYRAVNYGVKAIQSVAKTGSATKPPVAPGIVCDGWFGPATAAATKKLQAAYGAVADGEFGPHSARSVFGALIAAQETAHGIPDHLLCGIAMQESVLDPGAVGFSSPADKGLVQINTAVEPVSIAQAFDPYFAINYGAQRFMAAWTSYAGKGTTIQIACAVVQHNAPAFARAWYTAGTSPNAQATDYVNRVLGFAATF